MITGLSPLCEPEGRKEEHLKKAGNPSAEPLHFSIPPLSSPGEGSCVFGTEPGQGTSGELDGLVTWVRSLSCDLGSSLLCFDDHPCFKVQLRPRELLSGMGDSSNTYILKFVHQDVTNILGIPGSGTVTIRVPLT